MGQVSKKRLSTVQEEGQDQSSGTIKGKKSSMYRDRILKKREEITESLELSLAFLLGVKAPWPFRGSKNIIQTYLVVNFYPIPCLISIIRQFKVQLLVKKPISINKLLQTQIQVQYLFGPSDFLPLHIYIYISQLMYKHKNISKTNHFQASSLISRQILERCNL